MIEATEARADLSGPAGQLVLTVSKAEEIARGCRLIELSAADGALLPGAAPGAHVGLHLPNGIRRQYSLLSAGAQQRSYRIGVKRDAGSRGGSAYIVERMKVGDVLEVDPPRNNFPLAEEAPHSVFFAGGIGITPIWCMIQRLEELGRSWTLHYAARSREEAPLVSQLSFFKSAHFHFDAERGGFLPVADLVRAAPANAHLYCCGPAPMLEAFEAAAAGRDPSCIHVEYFMQQYEASLDGGFLVELARSGQEVVVRRGQTIMQALRDLGVDVPSSCEEGICGACETRVIAGVPDHRDSILSPTERALNKSIFVCCSGSKSLRLVLDL